MAPNYLKIKNFKRSLILFIFCFGLIYNNAVSQGPVVAVAPTKMNVLYLGVDNPITVAVESAKDANVKVSINNGSIRKYGNGTYVARPSKRGTAKISVSVGNKLVGAYDFRIKLVPDPVPCIVNLCSSGYATRAQLLAAKGLRAQLPNFDFDLEFKITSFTVSAVISGMSLDAKSNSSRFTDAQLDIIRQVPRGSKLYFENIHAVGPDGTMRVMPTLSVKIR
jgi:gliding motility-associated protein GldM